MENHPAKRRRLQSAETHLIDATTTVSKIGIPANSQISISMMDSTEPATILTQKSSLLTGSSLITEEFPSFHNTVCSPQTIPPIISKNSRQQLVNVRQQLVHGTGGRHLSMEQGQYPHAKPLRVPLEGSPDPLALPLRVLQHHDCKGIYALPKTNHSDDASPPEHERHSLSAGDDEQRSAEKQPNTISREINKTPAQPEHERPFVHPSETADHNGRPIYSRFPTLIRLDSGDYVELRCPVCGGNYSRRDANGTFISGLPGFQRHLHSAHGRGRTYIEVLRECAFARLSAFQVRAMLRSLPVAYRIEQVKVAPAEPGTAVTKPRQRQSFKKKAAEPATKKQGKRPSEGADSRAMIVESADDDDYVNDGDDEE